MLFQPLLLNRNQGVAHGRAWSGYKGYHAFFAYGAHL